MKKAKILLLAVWFLVGCTTEEDPALLDSVFFGAELSDRDLIVPELYKGISSQFRNPFLLEDFSSNTNGWFIGESSNKLAVILNGQYICEVKRSADIFAINLPNFNTSLNYEIETEFTAKNSVSDYTVAGLAIGHLKASNNNESLLFSYISNNGEFRCGLYDDAIGGWDASWYGPKFHNEVNLRENSNKLTVRQYNGTMYFFVNEKLLYSQKSQNPPGSAFGLLSASNNLVYYDYLNIYYLKKL